MDFITKLTQYSSMDVSMALISGQRPPGSRRLRVMHGAPVQTASCSFVTQTIELEQRRPSLSPLQPDPRDTAQVLSPSRSGEGGGGSRFDVLKGRQQRAASFQRRSKAIFDTEPAASERAVISRTLRPIETTPKCAQGHWQISQPSRS